MKKTIIALLALAGVVSADGVVNIDFGRADSQTEGFYNIHTADNFTTGSGSANYVNGANSATTTHNMKLGPQDIVMTYTHTTAVNNYGGKGLMPTLTDTEEGGGWKNAFSAALPTGVTGNVHDGLTTQNPSGTGSHVLTFTGLAAGTYSLSAFGGFYGKDDMAAISITLGNGLTADWTSQSIGGSNAAWTSASTTSDAAEITFSADGTNGVNHGYYFTADGIVVGEGGTLQVTIAGTGGKDSRTPLNYVSLKMIPEPTTATLSLLALAGLAARRRRR